MKKIFILVLLFAPSISSAAGIEVAPSKLELAAGANQPAVAQITVSNPTADVQIFEVYPDDFTDRIKITPASFTLEAGGRGEVIIEYSDGTQSQILNTAISVVAKPLAESRFQANTGVKIPLTITAAGISKPPPAKVWYPLGGAVLIAAAYALGRFGQRKKANAAARLP